MNEADTAGIASRWLVSPNHRLPSAMIRKAAKGNAGIRMYAAFITMISVVKSRSRFLLADTAKTLPWWDGRRRDRSTDFRKNSAQPRGGRSSGRFFPCPPRSRREDGAAHETGERPWSGLEKETLFA